MDEDDEEEDGDGTGLQETGSKKKKSSLGTVKILNVKLADKLFDGQTQKNSYSKATSEETKFSKMLNDFLVSMTTCIATLVVHLITFCLFVCSYL